MGKHEITRRAVLGRRRYERKPSRTPRRPPDQTPNATTTRRAVFLDRDGVINRPIVRDAKPYSAQSLDEFELLPGVDKACQMLKEAGFLLIVATNQPDVGRGKLQREIVEAIHATMLEQLPIDRVMVCYHSGQKAGDPCDCRKPRPGMLLNAAKELRIDLSQSVMIGDRWRDIECGARAGCQTIFIDWGYKESLAMIPDRVARDLLDAAIFITNSERSHERTGKS